MRLQTGGNSRWHGVRSLSELPKSFVDDNREGLICGEEELLFEVHVLQDELGSRHWRPFSRDHFLPPIPSLASRQMGDGRPYL